MAESELLQAGRQIIRDLLQFVPLHIKVKQIWQLLKNLFFNRTDAVVSQIYPSEITAVVEGLCRYYINVIVL